jgi:MFS family permease
LPPKRGIVVLGAAALVGTLITVLTGSDPGLALGVFVVIGTLAACLAVRSSSVSWIIPVPALAYLVGALIAGLIHDRAADASRTELAINVARWFASGFVAMTVATSLVVVIAAGRLVQRRRGAGHGQSAAQRPSTGRQPPARGTKPR